MGYETHHERATREALARIEGKVDALAAAFGGPTKAWADYATNHGRSHPEVMRRLEEAGREYGTRGLNASGTAKD